MHAEVGGPTAGTASVPDPPTLTHRDSTYEMGKHKWSAFCLLRHRTLSISLIDFQPFFSLTEDGEETGWLFFKHTDQLLRSGGSPEGDAKGCMEVLPHLQ